MWALRLAGNPTIESPTDSEIINASSSLKSFEQTTISETLEPWSESSMSHEITVFGLNDGRAYG